MLLQKVFCGLLTICLQLLFCQLTFSKILMHKNETSLQIQTLHDYENARALFQKLEELSQ